MRILRSAEWEAFVILDFSVEWEDSVILDRLRIAPFRMSNLRYLSKGKHAALSQLEEKEPAPEGKTGDGQVLRGLAVAGRELA